MSQRAENIINGIAVVVFLGVCAYIALAILNGCGSHDEPRTAQAVENALAVAQYDAALRGCQTEARKVPEPVRFDAYVACEIKVSRHLCQESPDLARVWTRCPEVLR